MSSYEPELIDTNYQILVEDLKLVPNIYRNRCHVQNKSNTKIWVRFGDDTQREYLFYPNVDIAFDFPAYNDNKSVYIKAEELINNKKVVITLL